MIRDFKPSDVNIDNAFAFVGSDFRNSERETLARNIVFISGDDWIEFTASEYAEKCKHTVTDKEIAILKDMARGGWLDLIDGKYSVNHKFLGCIEKFAL